MRIVELALGVREDHGMSAGNTVTAPGKTLAVCRLPAHQISME